MNQYYKNAPHGGAFFETAQKGQGPFWAKGLQSAARIICPLMADKFHTCRPRSIFCQVHAPAKNGLNLICRLRAANSARLFCERGRAHAPTVVYREVPVIAAGHMGPALRNVY